MKKLFEIYLKDGIFIVEPTNYAQTLLNQSQKVAANDNVSNIDINQHNIEIEPSARVFQVCEVIKLVCNGKSFNSAFSEVANRNGIDENTVRDKCCRQLGLKMEEFIILVKAYRDLQDKKIVDILKSLVSPRSSQNDLKYIEQNL